MHLAAWFHGAVHLRECSTDEERSARLAERVPFFGGPMSSPISTASLLPMASPTKSRTAFSSQSEGFSRHWTLSGLSRPTCAASAQPFFFARGANSPRRSSSARSRGSDLPKSG
ncbi:hypothetical protein [Streptomyces sp. NPDC057909]|uniref:hypothetical protein n=1 Tax=Streptomyces sp. NPDC057909 TaxID=3346277 RepID=UPI0036E21C60